MPRIFLPPVTPGNNALLASDSQQQQQQVKRSTVFDFDDEDDDGEHAVDNQDSTTEGSDSGDDDGHNRSSPDLLHPKNVGVHPACQRTSPSSRKGGVVGASRSVGSGGGISESPIDKNKNAGASRGPLKRGPHTVVANVDNKARTEDGGCLSQRKRPRWDDDTEIARTLSRQGDNALPSLNTSRTGAPQEDNPAANADAAAFTSPAGGKTNGKSCGGNLRIEGASKMRRAEDSNSGGESGSFTVVFIAQTLGLTIAQDDAGYIIVCDKEDTSTHGNSAAGRGMVSIGDRVVTVGGTAVAGLDMAEVKRMLVRGPRPLEVVFRRMPRVPKPQGTRERANKPSPRQQRDVLKAPSTSVQPLGGLERPSRDCLLDTISNIATQEDSLAEAQLLNGTHESPHWGSGAAAAAGVGAHEKNVSSSGNRIAVDDKDGNRTTPARDARVTSQPLKNISTAGAAPPKQARTCVPYTPSAAPSSTVSTVVSDAQARMTSRPLETISTAGAAPPKQARTCVPCTPSTAHFSTVSNGVSDGGPRWAMAEGLAFTLPDVVRTKTVVGQPVSALRLAQPSAEGRDTESTRDVNGGRAPYMERPKPKESIGGSTPASKPPERHGIIASSAGVGVGAPGSNKKVPAVIPDMDEVIGILTKLGSKGVSELTLYKSLTFDDLVRVSRYAGVDLSKRLSKVAMAERLNSLYVERGVLRHEQHIAATKRGRGGEGTRGPSTNKAARHHNMLNPLSRTATTSDAIGKPVTFTQNVSCARPLPPLSPPPPPPPPFSYPHEARVQSPRRYSAWDTTTASKVSSNERILTPQPRRAADWLASASLRQGSPLNVARAGSAVSGNHLGLDLPLAAQAPGTPPRLTGGGDKDEDRFWEDWNYHEHVAVGGGQKNDDEGNEASWWRGGSDGDWTMCPPPPSPPRWSAQGGRDRRRSEANTSGWRNPLLPTVRSMRGPQIRGLPDETRFSVLPEWIPRPVRTVGTQTPNTWTT